MVQNQLVILNALLRGYSVFNFYHKRWLSPTGKSHKVWMMMMIAANLIWAVAAEKPEQSKMMFKNQKKD